MPALKQLIHEIHRRSMWQVLGIYLAGSWIAMQVVETLTNNAGLPDWVPPFAIVLLVIGFPVVMGTAFVQEGTGRKEPGELRVEEVSPAERPLSPEVPRHHHLFTWRNAIIGGIAAFTLLGVVSAGYMAMRTLGIGPVGSLVASGLLDERSALIVAEFESTDSILAQAVTEAFRIDLSQSTVISVVEPSEVGEALIRMERDPSSSLTPKVARELAIREGIPAVMAGEINSAGSQILISARLLMANDGDVLASYRETAADSADIVAAVDRLSRKFREKIGESLKTIRADPPLAAVTTADLGALRKYSQALQAIEVSGDEERGIALLEEAVAIDTSFAMAYRKLGASLGNRGERARAIDAITRAFENRDRLTERERYFTIAMYHEAVTGERSKSMSAYQNILELEPDNAWALNNLGNVYEYLRDFPRAEELFSHSARVDSVNFTAHWNLAAVQVAQAKFDPAAATVEEMSRQVPGHPYVERARALLAASQHDYGAAEEHFQTLRQDQIASALWQARTSSGLGALDLTRGRLSDAERRFEDAVSENLAAGRKSAALGVALTMAWADLGVRGDSVAAVRRLEQAIDRHSLDDLSPQEWSHLDLASFYALAGDVERARGLIVEYEAVVPVEERRARQDALYGTQGDIALAEGRYEDAIAEYHRADVGWCTLCAPANLANAFDLSGQADSAIVYYEKYLTTHWFYWRPWFDATLLGSTYERLGELYDERGDLEKAAGYYSRFVDLWEEADPELQPRVRSARQRMEQIAAERG